VVSGGIFEERFTQVAMLCQAFREAGRIGGPQQSGAERQCAYRTARAHDPRPPAALRTHIKYGRRHQTGLSHLKTRYYATRFDRPTHWRYTPAGWRYRPNLRWSKPMTLAVLACCVFFLQSVTPEIIEHARAGAAAHANLGDAYFQNGDYDQAIAELETALRINPKLMGSHQTLG